MGRHRSSDDVLLCSNPQVRLWNCCDIYITFVSLKKKRRKNLEGPLLVADRKKMKKQKHRQVEIGAKLNTYERRPRVSTTELEITPLSFPSPRSLLYNVNSFGNQAGACLHVRSVPGMH